ncbi:hypothetical protein IF1G_05783 [Cordyceps javanica]|uniref:Uncharacterized protein n=1 Tax=Cordyceps javanica TaxID=43265 RepID=A0A545V2L4_9HYPO|nr:hypothetical protein IF1G_05783 [Cordyceps javanica]
MRKEEFQRWQDGRATIIRCGGEGFVPVAIAVTGRRETSGCEPSRIKKTRQRRVLIHRRFAHSGKLAQSPGSIAGPSARMAAQSRLAQGTEGERADRRWR